MKDHYFPRKKIHYELYCRNYHFHFDFDYGNRDLL